MWRCPECRTRRKDFDLFMRHIHESGHALCKTCASNLAKRIQRDAEAKEFGKPGAIPLVPENTTGDVWENAIRKIGVHSACEWFGYPADHRFTLDTINVLRDRSEGA